MEQIKHFFKNSHLWDGVVIVNDVNDNYNFVVLKPESTPEGCYDKLLRVIKNHGKYDSVEIKEMVRDYDMGIYIKFLCDVTNGEDTLINKTVREYSLEYAPLI